MKILVTGAKGFAGRNLVANLKNIRDGKNRTRSFQVEEIFEFDIDTDKALLDEYCAKAIDMGDFYRVPADNRGLNYDKYFKEGDEKRNVLTEFNSSNTKLLTVAETKEKIASLSYIQDRLAEMGLK